MPINPRTITVRPGTGRVPIEFSSWDYVAHTPIAINPLDTDAFGATIELPTGPWTFDGVEAGPDGAGVKAFLVVRKTTDQDVLWDQKAELHLYCEYAPNPDDIEMLTVRLEP